MKIESARRERSVPTPIQYQVERIISPAASREFPDDAPAEAVDAWLEAEAARQEAYLDRRERAIRAAYGARLDLAHLTPPAAAPSPVRGPAPAAAAPEAPASVPYRSPGPPKPTAAAVGADFFDGVPRADPDPIHPDTRKELRRIAMLFQERTGQPVNRVPKTQAEAEAMTKDLQASLDDLARTDKRAADLTKQREARWSEKDARFKTHDNPNWPQADAIAPGMRRCNYGTPPGDRAKPCTTPLDVAGWNYSINTHGRPLCKAHDPRNAKK